MDVTHILLTIILVLTALIGLGLIVALALIISTLVEAFALIKAVRTEISTAGAALRAIGEGIGNRVGGVLGLVDFFKKPSPKKSSSKTTAKK